MQMHSPLLGLTADAPIYILQFKHVFLDVRMLLELHAQEEVVASQKKVSLQIQDPSGLDAPFEFLSLMQF